MIAVCGTTEISCQPWASCLTMTYQRLPQLWEVTLRPQLSQSLEAMISGVQPSLASPSVVAMSALISRLMSNQDSPTPLWPPLPFDRCNTRQIETVAERPTFSFNGRLRQQQLRCLAFHAQSLRGVVVCAARMG